MGIIEDLPLEDNPKRAVGRALFQARKLILRHWKDVEPPRLGEWIAQMGCTLRAEKYIYQHRKRGGRFELLWAPWLNSPGLAPLELVLDRLLI